MRVDQAAAERFLRERYGGAVEAVQPIAQQGVWSSAYVFERGGARYVIRLTAHRDDLERDRSAARFASDALPIPPILEIGDALGASYAISPYVAGVHLDTLDERAMRGVLPSLFHAMDAIRRVDVSGSHGFGGRTADGDGERATWHEWLLDVRRDRGGRGLPPWRERMAASATGIAPFDRAFETFQSLVARCPEHRHLVHNDLLHFNVLVAEDRITAVLDWGSSMYGDFLYDLAKFTFFSPWYPAWSAIDFAREAADFYRSIGVIVPPFAERLRCFEIHIGLEHQAWYAARGDHANLDRAARRTLAIAESR